VTTARIRRRLTVRGVVQGVGMRPFVYTTAAELSLTGRVSNDSSGVFIEIEGAPAALDEFARRLRTRPPPLAVIESVEQAQIAVRGGTGFHIAETTRGDGRTLASPDVALCADCAAELRDPANRRYRHPFINCTNCGPRFTIIATLPYDRANTSMSEFDMCTACAREYADPRDRRFHAQPIACPDCGPTLSFSELISQRPSSSPDAHPSSRHAFGRDLVASMLVDSGQKHAGMTGNTAATTDPITAARDLLRRGGILAVKGIGGYHLACDAGSTAAVVELRRRKRRGDKPFAVMAPNLTTARAIAEVDDAAAALLSSPARPIVLLPRRDPASTPGAPVEAVAPRNPDLGVLLAYTPIHLLLFGLPGDPPGPRVLVMTSGNLGGEPICYDDADARDRLTGLADAILAHDRRILVPCDDSVLRLVDGLELPVRRSRGYAPLPLALPMAVPPTLAVGADLKNTCAVAEGRYAWLSQHVGDMDDLATLRAFAETEHHLEELTGVHPVQFAADAHPRYRSTQWARSHAGALPVRTVQHHHAHIAAVMGEHGLDPNASVLGFAFDGTGFGPDGAIWGGEVLLAGYKGFRRLAHLRYVPLAGGDAAVHRPYRMALAHLWAAGIDWSADIPAVRACPRAERNVLARQLETGFGCVPTSSMGRLFDTVASLAGVRHTVDYEAQATIELEGLARTVRPGTAGYRFGVPETIENAQIDPAPVLAAVIADVREGIPAAVIGARFHDAVAHLVLDVAMRGAPPDIPVALSGGVFQNALLLRITRRLLRDNGFAVLSHHRLPPNDGGLAFGQLLAAGAS